MTASCPGLSASTSIPKMSCVFGPSLIWNRGSAVVSVESISSTRPSSGAALFAAGNEIAKRAPAAGGSARSCGGRDDAATRASGRPTDAAASWRVVMEAPLAVEQWWAADGMALLHLPREGEDALLAERLADDLEAHRQASRVQATGHRRHRQPGETQHEPGGDPIHGRLHLLPGDDRGVDADPGDVGTVGDPKATRDAACDGTHEIPPGHGLGQRGERARPAHGLQH